MRRWAEVAGVRPVGTGMFVTSESMASGALSAWVRHLSGDVFSGRGEILGGMAGVGRVGEVGA